MKPNQPTHKKPGADDRHRKIVGSKIFGAVPFPFSKYQGRDKAGNAGIDVHDRAACEVEQAGRSEETAPPHPVSDGQIDKCQP